MSLTPQSRKPKLPRCRVVKMATLVPPMRNGVRMGVPKTVEMRCKNAATLDGLCTTHMRMREMGRELDLAQDE
ncbi:hypothetical protein [Methylobacterium gnaphalii]|nr:hypothetical protein [Methylobacterium gnaphalii]GJD71439.1 hypothetical protein MMMDOFMJ_4398 [Methylobacterium gnaphalii]